MEASNVSLLTFNMPSANGSAGLTGLPGGPVTVVSRSPGAIVPESEVGGPSPAVELPVIEIGDVVGASARTATTLGIRRARRAPLEDPHG